MRVRQWRHQWLAAVSGLVGAALAAAGTLAAHPLHTTMTELTFRPADRTAVAIVRVFADDFGTAVGRHTGVRPAADHTVPPRAAFAYLSRALIVIGRDGQRLSLTWCGERRAGEVLFMCVRAPAPGGLRGMRVASTLMFEMFADQVNIVQAVDGRRKQSLLFTPGARPKLIR